MSPARQPPHLASSTAHSRVRRRVNQFFLYRRDAISSGAVSSTFVDTNGEVKNRRQAEISVEVATMWRSAPEVMRVLYRMLAEVQNEDLATEDKELEHKDSTHPEASGAFTVVGQRVSASPDTHAAVDVACPCSTQHQQTTIRGTSRSRAPIPKIAKIPRPQNAFILYRRDALVSGAVTASFTREDGQRLMRTQAEMSKDIAYLWHNAPVSVKEHYNALAEQKKREHKEKYPEYRFSPKASRKANRHSAIAASTSCHCPRLS
ncbi:slightly ste11-like protein [Marasmius crinis-equi]|uniref:Slightly ste11-like protein n=1 Tax=Marasmius crinis-equi TaxID=585013 RepID=A0ABR3FLP5_9AGAR